MTALDAAQTAERTPWTARRLPLPALIPVAGLAWWVGGFLAWLVDGLGREMFIGNPMYSFSPMALPLVAGNISTLVLGSGVGGLAAGLITTLARGTRLERVGAASAGVALTLLVTLMESRSAIGDTGPAAFDNDDRVTNGLTVIVVVMTIAGLGVGLLALTGSVGMGLALGGVAGATPMWLAKVLSAVGGTEAGNMQHTYATTQWFGAAVLVAALVIVGLRPAARVAAWPGIVLLAWIIGPTLTAAGYLEAFLRPGMGLPHLLRDFLSAATDVWRMAASPEARPLTPWIAAIVVAVGTALWLARRPSSATDQPAP